MALFAFLVFCPFFFVGEAHGAPVPKTDNAKAVAKTAGRTGPTGEKTARDIAAKLAALAKSLEAQQILSRQAAGHGSGSGPGPDHGAGAAALFILRCLPAMVAEDMGLLPRGSFTALLGNLERAPQDFAPAMADIRNALRTGGFSASLGVKAPRVPEYLLADAAAPSLSGEQIALLRDAAGADWKNTDPAVLGTLLERALSPWERRTLGAPCAPTAHLERLVIPTVIERERALWEGARKTALDKAARGDAAGAVGAIEGYYAHLANVTVLDPSCGSGSFLAVALTLLKDIEGEVAEALRTMGLSGRAIRGKGFFVGPDRMRGIETSRLAADIARLVLWIAYLQGQHAVHGGVDMAGPVDPAMSTPPPGSFVGSFAGGSVECRDPLLAWDSTKAETDAEGRAFVRYVNPRPAAWPEADYIIGSPPGLDGGQMRRALGDAYVDALREVWPELPENADYAMYWWHRSASLAREGAIRRFGFAVPGGVRRTPDRRVVEMHVNPEQRPEQRPEQGPGQRPQRGPKPGQGPDPGLTILFAVPDHPWHGGQAGSPSRYAWVGSPSQYARDGSPERVAMTVCGMERRPGVLAEPVLEYRDGGHAEVILDTLRGRIRSDLTVALGAADLTQLKANARLARRGVTIVGREFIVTREQAKNLGLGRVPGLEKHIRPYVGESDLARGSGGRMVLDLSGLDADEAGRRFPEVRAWVADAVKGHARRDNRRQFGDIAPDMREAMAGLRRYIATTQTARRFYFTFLDARALPDDKLMVFASDDAYVLGVLSSSIHGIWTGATSGRLGAGSERVYIKAACFDAFPFPDAGEEQKARIRALAEAMDAHGRQRRERHPGLAPEETRAVLERMRHGVPLTPRETLVRGQGGLDALLTIHADLDAAVAGAYGWPADLPPDAVLARLLERNARRAAEERAGKVAWLRPAFQNPGGGR